MKAYEIIGYVEDGEVFCSSCITGLDKDEDGVIFAGDEGTYTCSVCGETFGEGEDR